MENAYLDVAIIRCPSCRKLYVDASWYILDMESDIECGVCGESFNTHSNLVKRALLRFSVSRDGIHDVEVEELIE